LPQEYIAGHAAAAVTRSGVDLGRARRAAFAGRIAGAGLSPGPVQA
jgi:hypothetical protein